VGAGVGLPDKYIEKCQLFQLISNASSADSRSATSQILTFATPSAARQPKRKGAGRFRPAPIQPSSGD